jgi:hypothetical protein
VYNYSELVYLLVTFSPEEYLLSVLHTLDYVNLQHFGFSQHLLALAYLTVVLYIHHFPFPVASTAH